MGTLILDLDLEPDAAVLHNGQIRLALGNGVTMNIKAPPWVVSVHKPKLVLTLDVGGSPPDAKPREPPVG